MKRYLYLIITILLIFSTLLLPASGSMNLAFVAVNDSIPLTLSENDMPRYFEGELYLPYTAFDVSGLGVFVSYVPNEQTITLFNRGQRLTFYLNNQTVTDEDNITLVTSTVASGSMIFLPLSFCASHFGLQYTSLLSKDGYQVVRFTTGAEIYDDTLFLEKAENLISYRVEQYINPTLPIEPPVIPEIPVNPPDQEVDGNKEDDDEEEEVLPPNIFLAMTGVGYTDTHLEKMNSLNITGTFFLTKAEIVSNGDFVRKLTAYGHNIGLRPTDFEGDIVTQLQEANEVLDLVLNTKSLMVLMKESTDDETLQTLSNFYRVWVSPPDSFTAFRAVEIEDEDVLLVCQSDQLHSSLTVLLDEKCTFSTLRENTEIPY